MSSENKENVSGNAKKEKSIIDKTWDFLCSLKVNVIILILLALTSIFGTVLPQDKSETKTMNFILHTLKKFNLATPPSPEALPIFGDLSPSMQKTVLATAKFIKYAQLDDMYHSYWFVALLGLLCITITCCSIDKFPIVWRFFTNPKTDLDDNQVKILSLKEVMAVKMGLKEAAEKYKGFLSNNVATPVQTEIGGAYHFFSQKGLYSRLGVYVTHLSLLIIIIGALIGLFFGDKGYVEITEFTDTKEFWSRSQNVPAKLEFTLRCDGYETAYYPDSGQPKEFTSAIAVIDGGKEVKKQNVQVNHPLKHGGYTFYQSNYGLAEPNGYLCYILLDIVKNDDGAPLAQNIVLYEGRTGTIRGTQDKIELVISSSEKSRYKQLFQEYHFVSPVTAMLNLRKADGTNKSILLTPPYPQSKVEGDYKFIIKRVKPLEFAGLQVTKDPGVWTVYTGCGLMIIGTLIAFFTSHKRFWIRLEEDKEKGKVKVIFAANANKNKETFEREFERLKEKLIKA